jgi:excisionase family DNA binding protein
VRYQYRLPNFPKEKDWLTRAQAAQQLGVSATLLRRLIRQGTLPAHQVVPFAPWIIQRTDLELAAVQAAVQAVRAGRRRSTNEAGDVDVPVSLTDTGSVNLVSEGKSGRRTPVATLAAYPALVGGR